MQTVQYNFFLNYRTHILSLSDIGKRAIAFFMERNTFVIAINAKIIIINKLLLLLCIAAPVQYNDFRLRKPHWKPTVH